MASTPGAGPSQTTASGSQSSVAPQWRQFNFFDVDEVKDVDDLAQGPAAIRDLKPPIVTTVTSAHSPLPPSVLVSSGGSIALLNRDFVAYKTFRAWEGNGRCTAMLEAGGVLVAIGEEDGSRYPVLKIWDLTRDEKRKQAGQPTEGQALGAGSSAPSTSVSNSGSAPVLVRNVRIQNGQRPHPVSAMVVTSNLSHLAIGLGDGTVLLYRHLLQSLTTSPTALTSLPKARIIHESNEPVTGLGFREPDYNVEAPSSGPAARAPDADRAGSASSSISLFIVTTSRVLNAAVSGKGGEARTIDEQGCGLGCAVMHWDRRDMIVARDEAIYLYGPAGRGACYAYEGQKSTISVYKHNLIIVSPPFAPSAGSTSATVRNYVARTGASADSEVAKLTIFDLQNKVVAHTGTFRDGVRQVFSQWGSIFVLGSSNNLSSLDEHPTAVKLEALYKRNLYTLAISVARSRGVSDAGVAEIHKRYGDYLYGKGDFDGAMSQFAKTLGHLQPSYVIRKYLDAQRIQNLTTYLQELHERNLANPDHTTLLLNCYTKTGDRARLDEFIRSTTTRLDSTAAAASSSSAVAAATQSADDLPFDLDTAIRVCRQAGFYEHATYLAKKYARHEDYLRIQIEDAQEWDEALKYLRNLGPDACKENLILYGRTLLQQVPDATTELLIDLCSGTLGSSKRPPPGYTLTDAQGPNGSAAATTQANGSSGPAVLSYLGYNRVAGMFSTDSPAPAPTSSASSTAPVPGAKPNGAATTERKPTLPPVRSSTAQASTDAVEPAYTPPSPRQFYPVFVDHRDLFIRFLEAVVQSSTARTGTGAAQSDAYREDERSMWNTLIELHLTPDRQGEHISPTARERVVAILDSAAPYDPMHALILCTLAHLTEGLVKLWERMGMYEDVLRFYMAQPLSSTPPPSEQVLRYLDLYGSEHRHLYPLVLRYLTSSNEILGRHSYDLAKVLAKIDEERIMPPLAVVQLLSRNGVASVGAVKTWLKAKVQETRQDVESDKQLTQSYRSETEAKQKEIADLANPRQPEVLQVTRCASCSTQLDLPSVHFMCKHSFHQRCLSDSDPECPLCARNHSVIREIRRNQTRLADRHDLFLSEVHEADDGFAVVAGAFGRGVMGWKTES